MRSKGGQETRRSSRESLLCKTPGRQVAWPDDNITDGPPRVIEMFFFYISKRNKYKPKSRSHADRQYTHSSPKEYEQGQRTAPPAAVTADRWRWQLKVGDAVGGARHNAAEIALASPPALLPNTHKTTTAINSSGKRVPAGSRFQQKKAGR